jgi:hypothetical protein
MRKIGDASFFRIVDRLLAPDPARKPQARWTIDGVAWQRERHSYAGTSHGFTVEVTIGTRVAAPTWTLMVVKEYWRDAKDESIKSTQWAHIEAGSRADVVVWLDRQDRRVNAAS